MKNKYFKLIAIPMLLMLIYTGASACPKCNDDFKKELLEKRANTLCGKELLDAIKNQSSSEQSALTPVNYNPDNSLTEEYSFQEKIESSNSNFKLSSIDYMKIFISSCIYVN